MQNIKLIQLDKTDKESFSTINLILFTEACKILGSSKLCTHFCSTCKIARRIGKLIINYR